MRNSLIILLIFLMFILLTNSCLNMNPDYGILAEITIKNNTDDTIVCITNCKLSIYDTLLPEEKPEIDLNDNDCSLKPYSFKKQAIFGNRVYRDLQKFTDSYVLFYYFFNYDSFNTLPWSKIREKNIYMKRVIIDTKQDLENCNNVIAFP